MVDFFLMRLQEKILQLSFLRITVKPNQFLRLTANFFAVLGLTVDPIETLSFGNEFTSIFTFHSLMTEEANPMLSYLDISFKKDFKSRFFSSLLYDLPEITFKTTEDNSMYVLRFNFNYNGIQV